MAKFNYSNWNDGTTNNVITKKQEKRTRNIIENDIEKTHSEIERLRKEFNETKNYDIMKAISKKGNHLVELSKELLSL